MAKGSEDEHGFVPDISLGDARIMEEDHYLTGNHNLKEVNERVKDKLGRPLVVANYVADRNGVIAIEGVDGPPKEIQNDVDWEHYQELQAQADIIITAAGYLNRVKKLGDKAQNILNQFDKGGPFEKHGDWRLEHGYKRRNPDVAVVSRSLDFDFPDALTRGGRRVFIFTIYEMENSEKARNFRERGATVVGVGKEGVDGKIMIERLGKEGYEVVKMTTGPRVLKILLEAKVLDRLYVTQVQREIPGDPEKFITIPINENTLEEVDLSGTRFKLTDSLVHEGAKAKDGRIITQKFLVYDSEQFLEALNS
ncbi:dihydrofolate reductase family protein [Candidatus Woesebacteria bacterium]|nr:dihydrofolate reductase family protein [Candidatus Woesebacteria bacterium]